MKRLVCSLILIFVVFLDSTYANDQIAFKHDKIPNGISVTINNNTINITFFNPSTVRIVKYAQGKTFVKESLAVIAKPQETEFNTKLQDDYLNIVSSDLKVR